MTISRGRKLSAVGHDPGTRAPKHAGKATFRKPNRRRGSIARITVKRVAAVFLVSFFLGAIFPQLAITPARAATITADTVAASSEAHACHAVLVFSRLDALHSPGAGRAYRIAWQASGNADPEMRADIRRYLLTGRGWQRIYGTNADCTPDA